jgi:hypothetical protein
LFAICPEDAGGLAWFAAEVSVAGAAVFWLWSFLLQAAKLMVRTAMNMSVSNRERITFSFRFSL